jgi:D-lactate dehydrogenase (cytochrome)
VSPVAFVFVEAAIRVPGADVEETEVSKKDMDSLGLFGSMLGHVGDGNFHETILFDGVEEREKVEKCVHDMVQLALDMDGTCTVCLANTARGR